MVRYHNSGTQRFDDLESDSVNTDEATIGNITVTSDTSISRYAADEVSLSSSSPGDAATIFDLSDPVDVVSGSIYGFNPSNVTVTFEDGGTVRTSSGTYIGEDSGGDKFRVVSLPAIKDATKITFVNQSGTSRVYGWEVITT